MSVPSTFRLLKGELDLETGTVAGTSVRLSPTERALVAWLAAAAEPADATLLLTEVWGYREGVQSRTVYSTIDRVRRKLEVDPKQPTHLITVDGGYQLVEAPAEIVAPPGFVGRADELAWLRDALHDGGAVGLQGSGGVGKSRLAEVAVTCLDHRFRERVWVELRGVATPEAALDRIARSLELTRSSAERVQAALVARAPVLLVLDDLDALEDRASAVVQQLRPSAACTVLVTSRQRVDAVRALQLEPLAPWASRALLVHLAAAEVGEEALDTLASHLDHLPLALHLAAPWLGRVSVGQLMAHPGSLRELSACVQRSWDHLSPKQQRWLSDLALQGGRVPLSLALALGDDEGLDGLQVLASMSLVVIVDGHVRLLEAVRSFAAARAIPDPDDDRALQWATRACARCSGALYGPDHGAALQRLRDELDVLVHVLDGATRGPSWRHAVVDLADGLARLGPVPELDGWLLEVQATAEASDLQVRCRAQRSRLARHRGSEALQVLGDSIADDLAPEVQASWRVQRGMGRVGVGQLDEAVADFEGVLELGLGNHVEVRRAWYGLARVFRAQQDAARALEAVRELEGLARLAVDPMHELVAWSTRALVLRGQGKLLEAEVWARRAYEAALVGGEPVNAAHLAKALSTLIGLQERPAESSRYLREAARLYRRHGLLESEGYVQMAQAMDALWAGRLRECAEHLAAVEEAFARSGFRRGLSAVEGLRGRQLLAEGHAARALEAFDRAVTLLGESPPARLSATLVGLQALCGLQLGRSEWLARARALPDEGGLTLLREWAEQSATGDPEALATVREAVGSPAMDRRGLGV